MVAYILSVRYFLDAHVKKLLEVILMSGCNWLIVITFRESYQPPSGQGSTDNSSLIPSALIPHWSGHLPPRPGRRQAIIWTNAGILLIGPLGTNFSEILIEIQTFSFKKIDFKMSSVKWRPFCLGLNVLRLSDRSLPGVRKPGLSIGMAPVAHHTAVSDGFFL